MKTDLLKMSKGSEKEGEDRQLSPESSSHLILNKVNNPLSTFESTWILSLFYWWGQ